MLWSVGIRHGDISDNNLMWDPKTQKPKLCDFDLSHLCEKPRRGVEEVGSNGPAGFSNTRTWIFMAEELLDDGAMAGEVRRVYRHEVEAFIAVLIWIICRYQDGKLRAGNPLGHWIQTSYLECSAKRRRTFNQLKNGAFVHPSGVADDDWKMIRKTLKSMALFQAQLAVAKGHESDDDLTDSPLPYPGQVQRRRPFDFNNLCALGDILKWAVFQHPACTEFSAHLRRRILEHTSTQLAAWPN